MEESARSSRKQDSLAGSSIIESTGKANDLSLERRESQIILETQRYIPLFSFNTYFDEMVISSKLKRFDLTIMVYSYAYEFHQALAILSMLSKGGRKFAWGDGLESLKMECHESESYIEKSLILTRMDKMMEPMIEKSMASIKRLGVKIPYVTRESKIQVPSNDDLRKMLALQISGQRNRISSLSNEYSNTIQRTTTIHIEEEKRTEVITELVDEVPGKEAHNWNFPGEVKEGVELFRLYVVPQQRLAIHQCFVRSLSIPKY